MTSKRDCLKMYILLKLKMQEGKNLEGFEWEEDALLSSHAPVVFHPILVILSVFKLPFDLCISV